MAGNRPDLSGDWALNRDACTLSAGASAVRSAKLHIEHRDPVIRCAARFEFNDGNAFAFTTERTATETDATPAADGSARWDGDGLVFTDFMGETPDLVTMTWRYEVVDNGRRLRAVERMRGGGRDQDNVWVFDRDLTAQRLYHGTKVDLKAGDLIEPGYASNYGAKKTAAFVYMTATLDAATWGAELAVGDGPGRIYVVEPTGPIEDDPNLTDKKFPGNPTKSYRSRQPLRVTGEVTDWQGHSPEQLQAMKDGLARLKQQGIEAIED